MQTDQDRVNDIAATFNRVMRKTNDEPAGPAKVIMLQILRGLLEKLKGGTDVMILDNLPAVEASIAGIEAECRFNGSFAAYADMSRAERRRLTKAARLNQ